ncbi:unnamed protein product [Gordionus sp. m RMFG-2023]
MNIHQRLPLPFDANILMNKVMAASAYHDPGFGTNIVEEQQIFTCRQNLKERGIMGYNLKSLEYFQWSECSSLYIRYNLRKNGGCLKKSISKTNLYKIDSTYYHYIYAYVPDQYCHSYYGKNYRADYNMSNCHKMRCRKEAWKTDKFIPSPDYSFCHKDTLASLPTGFVRNHIFEKFIVGFPKHNMNSGKG